MAEMYQNWRNFDGWHGLPLVEGQYEISCVPIPYYNKQVLSYVVLSQWNSEKKSLNAVHKRQLEATN